MKKKATVRAYGRKKTQLWPLCANTTATLASLALFSTMAIPAMAQTDSGDAARNLGNPTPEQLDKLDAMKGLRINQDDFKNYITTGNPGAVSDPKSLRKVFFIYNPSTKKFLSLGGYWGTHAALSDTPHPFWIQDETEYSVDQYITYPRRAGEKKVIQSLMQPLFAAKTLHVGSMEGGARSHATYKTIKYSYTDDQGQEQTTDLLSKLGADYKPNGASFDIPVSVETPLANGRIEVEMDLAACLQPSETANKMGENILSIGTDIAAWGKGSSIENLHLYYWKDQPDDRSQNKVKGNLEIEYVNHDWTDARRLYLKTSGDQLKVSVSRGGVTIYYQDADGAAQTATFYPSIDVDYVAGKENQTVYFAKNENGSFQVDANGKMVYNPELTAQTGTPYICDAPLTATGTPTAQRFFISTSINKNDVSYNVEGKYLAYTCAGSNRKDYEIGAYADRKVGSETIPVSGYDAVGVAKKLGEWSLDYVEGSEKNLCYLTLSIPFDDQGVYDAATGDRTFYLRPSAKYVQGPGPDDRNTYYAFDLTAKKGEYTDRTQADQADLYADQASLGEIAQWKIVTALDYYKAAMQVKQELVNPTDLSFLIMDNNFRRDNGYLSKWVADATLITPHDQIGTEGAKLRIGVDQYYKADPKSEHYHDATGKEMTQTDSKAYNQELYNRSRYSGVCITNGGYGTFYQDVTVYAPGWYTVACKGISNAEALLYAKCGDNGKAAALAAITKDMSTLIGATSAQDCYWPLDVNHPIYNSVALMSDPFVKGTDKDDNFETKLWIYVPGASQTEPKTLRIGVYVPKGGGAATLDEQAGDERATAGAELPDWTVFTDFRLYYGGQTNEKQYLVLDEDWTDYSTLESIRAITSTRTLCLNRRLKDKYWNTIILPVGLTKEQFESTFGVGAELAELSEMTDREIRFDRVLAEKESKDGKQYWLMPNTPYIIRPLMKGLEPEYTGQYTPIEGSGVITITVPAGHYKIPGVQFTAPYFPTESLSSGGRRWTMDYLHATVGGTKYPYLVATDPVSGPADEGETAPTLTAYGMLAANYTEVDGTKTPVSDRYQLENAYVMSADCLTRLGTEGTASKGYRCFFAYSGKNGEPNIPTLYIDGVSQVTLGIDDILAADGTLPAAVAPQREGVYNLQGQQLRPTSDTTGLPAGLYIVGGRKVLVK